MTYLFNDPADFADELVDGFVAANAHLVRKVPGGVVRARRARAGEVAVIIGGGSGHYPAFAGLVGTGAAHGAAMGNLFASPSAQQVYEVAKAAENGGGVLLSYGNYAGDVLNFDQAEARLNAEGIRCRTALVTDDVSSASASEIGKRRGIAGGLVVFTVAGAAAEAGADLDEVWRLATLANERTRTLGVAFSGCTLPGATEPLFSVAAGRMEVGMGIHGEPGIEETDVPTADQLAELFVDTLLENVPGDVPRDADSGTGRVALVLNGLGSVKYEELFVVYRRLATLLSERGLTVVQPEVGEFVTSFEMAGASLTLCWLTEELEQLWEAPAYTPAYRKGRAAGAEQPDAGGEAADDTADGAASAGTPSGDHTAESIPQASESSRAAALVALTALAAADAEIEDQAEELGRLDAIAGDGDHGIGMRRGVAAAVAAMRAAVGSDAGIGTALERAGDAWANRGGGTSGALWGLGLRTIGSTLGNDDAPNAADIAAAIARAQAEIVRVGKAELGDKTLLDTLSPFVDALNAEVAAGHDLTTAWAAAADTADRAAIETATLTPKIGRARPHAAKSVGTPDPGAVSMALVIRAIQQVLSARGEGLSASSSDGAEGSNGASSSENASSSDASEHESASGNGRDNTGEGEIDG